MTPKQLKVLEAIEEYWDTKHCGPSLEAIASIVGVSSRSTVHAIVKRLHEDGWITMQPKRWRTMMSVRKSPLDQYQKVVAVAEVKEEIIESVKPKVIYKTTAHEQTPNIVVEKKISTSEKLSSSDQKKKWLARMDNSEKDEFDKLLEKHLTNK
tara:strand:+ start:201 stop:659 length:459 start_codon:yes stop_codon:yes gene_type:complete